MIKILAIHEARTEHAKEVRKQTGANDYRDKAIFFRDSLLMQCIGTFQTKDNLLAFRYEQRKVMNEIQTIVVGLLNTPPFDKRFAQIRRVFAVKGIAPTGDRCGGGGTQPKILVEYD